MINKIKSFLAFGALVAVSSATATEYRTPWVSERGPLRYSFDKLNEDKYNLNIWKVMHSKIAKKAYGRKNDCGSATKKVPITTLLFNKADFRVSEIFPNSTVPINSENLNPFTDIFCIHPRVHYYEWGATFGGRFDIPVYKDGNKVRGRFGVRATVPVRCIEMERKDITDPNADPLSEVVATDVITVNRRRDGTNSDPGDVRDVVVKAFRLDFVRMIQNGNKTSSILTFDPKNSSNVSVNGWRLFGNTLNFVDADNANIGVVYAPEETKPRQKAFQFDDSTSTPAFPVNTLASAANMQQITTAGVFDNDKVGFPGDASYKDLEAQTAENKARLASQWLVFKYDTETAASGDKNKEPDLVDTEASKLLRLLEARANFGTEGLEDFFGKNNFQFETSRRKGLGDIDIDIFYEHQFGDEWIAEVMLGVRLPTGSGKNKCDNPYKVNLGNGDHWEIKLGGLVAWEPYNWMNVKVDGYWSWVLENTEKRTAVFKGSKVKGIGPCVDAEVDWNYGVFNFDFNFIHPKTRACRSMIGYQYYYKGEDKVNYKKCKSIRSWLGRAFKDDGTFDDNFQELDSCLARANTQSVAHKLRTECSVMVNKYCEIFAGGAWTFAGKNVFCDVDGHIGFNHQF